LQSGLTEQPEKVFANYGLNGHFSDKGKLGGVVRLDESKHNIFGKDRIGHIKRVEVWTFENKLE